MKKEEERFLTDMEKVISDKDTNYNYQETVSELEKFYEYGKKMIMKNRKESNNG